MWVEYANLKCFTFPPRCLHPQLPTHLLAKVQCMTAIPGSICIQNAYTVVYCGGSGRASVSQSWCGLNRRTLQHHGHGNHGLTSIVNLVIYSTWNLNHCPLFSSTELFVFLTFHNFPVYFSKSSFNHTYIIHILGARCCMQAGFWVLDTECWVLGLKLVAWC